MEMSCLNDYCSTTKFEPPSGRCRVDIGANAEYQAKLGRYPSSAMASARRRVQSASMTG